MFWRRTIESEAQNAYSFPDPKRSYDGHGHYRLRDPSDPDPWNAARTKYRHWSVISSESFWFLSHCQLYASFSIARQLNYDTSPSSLDIPCGMRGFPLFPLSVFYCR
jgi:hypothetical protein